MEVHRLSLHKVCVQSLCFSPTEAYLATLGGQDDDNSLVIWDVAKGNAVCGTPAASDTAQCVKFCGGSDFQLVSGGNYHVTRWEFDLENKKLRPTQANLGQLKRMVSNLVVDPEDKFVYCGTSSGDVLQIDLTTMLFKQLAPKKCFPRGVTCSAMLPDGDILLGTGGGCLGRLAAGSLKMKVQAQVLGEVTSITLTESTSSAARSSPTFTGWTPTR
ncbi:unnamed protein product [Prorocentrum cordatum]|uniref:Cilia- and flagella-associated protein 52 n=1 Tax=Prorocentrum cordatum TaxID=2364126 RepID=A0ABN9S9L8_9DINO|nr:unnamed protein product [Polarella glacialis]